MIVALLLTITILLGITLLPMIVLMSLIRLDIKDLNKEIAELRIDLLPKNHGDRND